jgi:hypothetical protein
MCPGSRTWTGSIAALMSRATGVRRGRPQLGLIANRCAHARGLVRAAGPRVEGADGRRYGSLVVRVGLLERLLRTAGVVELAVGVVVEEKQAEETACPHAG